MTSSSLRTKARILIVDDHPMVREGLAMHIATQSDIEVCGEAEDMVSALKILDSCQADLVIVDISLKNSNGIDLVRRIHQRFRDTRTLIWSMYPESLYAERALRVGARGYLNKTRATRELMDAIRVVLAGKVYVSGDFTEEMLQRMAEGNAGPRSPIHCLSDRELQVFESMGQGMTTDAIAAKMHLSSKTIETYRIRIKQKLGIKNVTELVRRATHWLLDAQAGTATNGLIATAENTADNEPCQAIDPTEL